MDVYRAQDGALRLLTGSRPAPAGQDATLRAIAANGSRILWDTMEDVPGTGDTDARRDIYRTLSGTITGGTTLLSGSVAGGDAAAFEDASAAFNTPRACPAPGTATGSRTATSRAGRDGRSS